MSEWRCEDCGELMGTNEECKTCGRIHDKFMDDTIDERLEDKFNPNRDLEPKEEW